MISIIVPVYNRENKVGSCIASILNQTYTDLELILVDDGSTDNSVAVCEEYLQNRIRESASFKKKTVVSAVREIVESKRQEESTYSLLIPMIPLTKK